MGIQEKEIVELFREIQKEASPPYIASKPPIKQEVVGILTAARVLKQTMEKCTLEVCGAIRGSQPEYEPKLTLGQAIAIIDMDNIAYSESQGPRNDKALEGWDELIDLAQTISGLTADSDHE